MFSSVEPFLSKVETWLKNLSTVNEILNKWWFVQKKWIYLFEIYAGKENLHVLPEKLDDFYKLNKLYKEVCILLYLFQTYNITIIHIDHAFFHMGANNFL